MTLKHCNGCNKDKELSEFRVRKSGPMSGKPRSRCKECERFEKTAWRKENPEKVKSIRRAWRIANHGHAKEYARKRYYQQGGKSASENKACPVYLGCVVAETILSHEFPGFKRMPYGNKGFDYRCPKGFLIDVKSRCLTHSEIRSSFWHFAIRKNKVANYFLCIAFGDRDKPLVPEHIWLIPGNVVNEKMGFVITNIPESLAKWSQYERSLKNVNNCCDKLRSKI